MNMNGVLKMTKGGCYTQKERQKLGSYTINFDSFIDLSDSAKDLLILICLNKTTYTDTYKLEDAYMHFSILKNDLIEYFYEFKGIENKDNSRFWQDIDEIRKVRILYENKHETYEDSIIRHVKVIDDKYVRICLNDISPIFGGVSKWV